VGFNKKTLHDIDIRHMQVLLRADYNVPLNDDRTVASNYRLVQSLPTIKVLQEKGCKIIITSHLGRPKSADETRYSLKPVAAELARLLDQKVTFVADCIGDEVKKATDAMEPGDVIMLENVRFHSVEEESNDEAFAQALIDSSGAEVFVQDCFGVAHRAHASIVGVAKLIPAVAGLLIEKEVTTITDIMQNPAKPLMAIIGGAKIADKIEVIHKFIELADIIVIGGAMANTFLKAQDIEVGDSLVDEGELDTARDLMDKARAEAAKRDFIFYLPQDGVVATEIDSKAAIRIVDWDAHVIAELESYPGRPKVASGKVGKHEKILDIGPFSGAFIAGAMQLVKTVVWSGTMGVAEVPAVHGTVGPYAHGTEAVIDGLVGRYGNKPFSLLGGGDTTGYIDKRGMNDMFDLVSTGGSASLEVMAGRKLPGVECLQDKG
jgi:3-phosphoglycerate kinase